MYLQVIMLLKIAVSPVDLDSNAECDATNSPTTVPDAIGRLESTTEHSKGEKHTKHNHYPFVTIAIHTRGWFLF